MLSGPGNHRRKRRALISSTDTGTRRCLIGKKQGEREEHREGESNTFGWPPSPAGSHHRTLAHLARTSRFWEPHRVTSHRMEYTPEYLIHNQKNQRHTQSGLLREVLSQVLKRVGKEPAYRDFGGGRWRRRIKQHGKPANAPDFPFSPRFVVISALLQPLLASVRFI